MTERLGFSTWGVDDLPLARALWGDPAVTRLICTSGRFSDADVEARLQTELRNQREHGVQY